MQRYREIRPEIVFSSALVLSLPVGIVADTYINHVVELTLLVFGMIGLVAESFTPKNPQLQRNCKWLMFVVLISTGLLITGEIPRSLLLLTLIPAGALMGMIMRQRQE